MNRTLLFGIMVFLALVGISLIGSERQAVAGHGCYGCSGCHGCYGGCRGCHGCHGRSRRCHGCSGCVGCCGCCGGKSEAAPTAKPAAPTPEDASAYRLRAQRQAVLVVNVPADAKIYVNGVLTKSTGAHRRYVSQNLKLGSSYKYEVRAEFNRNGETIVKTEVRKLQAGQQASIQFESGAAQQLAATSATR